MSYILTNLLRKKVPEWNRRVLSEEDFFEICEKTRVSVIEYEIKSKGEYTVYRDQPFIIFRKGLDQKDRLWVGFHELGHHLLHYPVNHKFSRSIFRRMDREANFFAAISLMPTYLIQKYTLDEIVADYRYQKELIMIRKEIYEQYRI